MPVRISSCAGNAKIQLAHRVDQVSLGMIITNWRDIGDNELADVLWLSMCKDHRRLASHRVTQHVRWTDMRKNFHQIGGHVVIALRITARALAMISHINDHDVKFVR